jgi:hypothetical protein
MAALHIMRGWINETAGEVDGINRLCVDCSRADREGRSAAQVRASCRRITARYRAVGLPDQLCTWVRRSVTRSAPQGLFGPQRPRVTALNSAPRSAACSDANTAMAVVDDKTQGNPYPSQPIQYPCGWDASQPLHQPLCQTRSRRDATPEPLSAQATTARLTLELGVITKSCPHGDHPPQNFGNRPPAVPQCRWTK